MARAFGSPRKAFVKASADAIGVGGWKMRGCVAILRNPLNTWSETAYASSDCTREWSHARYLA